MPCAVTGLILMYARVEVTCRFVFSCGSSLAIAKAVLLRSEHYHILPINASTVPNSCVVISSEQLSFS